MAPASAGIKSLGTPVFFVDRSKPKRLEKLKNPVFQRTCTINASRMIPCVACTLPLRLASRPYGESGVRFVLMNLYARRAAFDDGQILDKVGLLLS
jgi:hypothetical protein